MTHPSAQHPEPLVSAVVGGLPAEWQASVRHVLMQTPAWSPWLVIGYQELELAAYWENGKGDARRRAETLNPAMPRIFVDVATRLRRIIEDTVEIEMSTVKWEPGP